MKYLLQSPWLLNECEFIERLALTSGSLVFVSCCPYRRAAFAKSPHILVLNPFKASKYGLIEEDTVLWIDQWPSLMSDRFKELRFYLFSEFSLVYLSQSFSFKGETKALKDFLFEEEIKVLWRERLKSLPLLKGRGKVRGLWEGIDSLGIDGPILLEGVKKWPTQKQNFLFIPFALEEHSYLYALGHRHNIAAITSISGSCLSTGFLSWLLGHHEYFEVRSFREDKNRGNPHPKSPLSGPSRYWNALTQKWPHSFGSLLRWPRWRKKA
jgi:hypothetical protein